MIEAVRRYRFTEHPTPRDPLLLVEVTETSLTHGRRHR